MLKLHNINEQKRNTILKYLINHPKIAWIGNLEGNYDIAFIAYVKDQVQLQETINTLFEKFNKYIMKKTISISLNAEFFPRDYLIDKERTSFKKISYKYYKNFIELDEIDNQICTILGKNSRTSAIELSKEIKISPDTILQRLKKLKKEEIILGYNIILDQEKINQSHYKLLIFLSNLSKQKEDKLLSFCRSNNRVISVIRTLAEWDYEIDLEMKDVNQLKNFTMELTNSFSDIIKDYDSIRILNMPKYTFFP